MKQPTWTLKELARQSTLFLNEDGQSQRITWKPNPRQIRYYTTLGLLDRPFGGRGYGNTYGPKHLLQLLSIKQLQHQGLKLAEIQPMLAGMSEKKMAELLRFDLEWLEEMTIPPSKEPTRRDGAFWEQLPPPKPAPKASQPTTIRDPKTFVHLELQPGITLVVDPSQMNGMTPTQQARLKRKLGSAVDRLFLSRDENSRRDEHREDPTSL